MRTHRLVALLAFGSLVACEDRARREQDDFARRRPFVEREPLEPGERSPAPVDRDYTYADRDDYIELRGHELGELDRDIERLETRARDATGDMKREIDEAVVELKRQREQLKNELDRMENVTESDWDAFRRRVDDSMDRLREGLRDIGRRSKPTS
jgi:uncharacterized protein YdcH (DUF465 family)